MNYKEALEYIHSISWCFCKPGLDRISALCTKIGDPQNALRFIHVAGTNGKGSFCSMMSCVLHNAGLKVGLFTSPYIRFFNERMQINGTPISDDELAEITTYVRPIAESMEDSPTEFELITAVAFEYFKRNKCDIVVLEAGMGGRLDSTNIISMPELSVITGIALDHTAFLGDTVEKIAAEKAGIIKNSIPVLFGGTDERARSVIKDTAGQRGSEYHEVDYSTLNIIKAELDGTLFDFGSWKSLHISLLGLYQPYNACVVLSAVEILKRRGYDISDEAVREGLLSARWQARFEVIAHSPLTIFDGAHNPQGIECAVESIKHYFKGEHVYAVSGVLRDKDYGYIASEIAEVADKVFTMTPDNPRALPASEYAKSLTDVGIEAQAFGSLADAYFAAREQAKKDGRVLVCLGSLYTYSSLIELV